MSCHSIGKRKKNKQTNLQPHVWMDEGRELPSEEKYSTANGSFIQRHWSFNSGLNVSGDISN